MRASRRGAAQGIGTGRFAADAGAAQIAVEGRLANLGVDLALVFLLDPRLGRGVEQVERELGLPLEHGQEAALDLSPERFLLSVLLRGVRQRRVVDDAEPLEPLDGLGGEHGRTVVRQERAWQSTFLERLREAVHEGLGGFIEIPLQMAAEARAVIENAEQLRRLPLPSGRQYGSRPLMKVQVPEAVHVGDLVRTRLARSERLAADGLAMTTFAGAQQTLLLS